MGWNRKTSPWQVTIECDNDDTHSFRTDNAIKNRFNSTIQRYLRAGTGVGAIPPSRKKKLDKENSTDTKNTANLKKRKPVVEDFEDSDEEYENSEETEIDEVWNS